ncbi:MAG: hypothetical protein M3Q89_01555, partial [Verrucomicrobiota bacterium]|nr:hypothetical protein [Verrucomicrobiota bacterium]
MNATDVPPPPPSAKGCCGIGCLTLFALLAFLAFAFVGGGMWALNHLRHTYSSTEPVTLPEAEPPTLGTAPTASPVTTPDPTSGTPLEA